MAKLLSFRGAEPGTEQNWSWCVAAGPSYREAPVVVLVMTRDGPRYLPTRVPAPNTYAELAVPYVELPPTNAEHEIADYIWSWMSLAGAELQADDAHLRRISTLNDILAAVRFLPLSDIRCEQSPSPIPEGALVAGRSVYVRPVGSKIRVQAWMASLEEPINLVCLNCKGSICRFEANFCEMEEDGSARHAFRGRVSLD